MVENTAGGESGDTTTNPTDPDAGDDGEEANLISFTIDGESYQAEEGMTWGEWVESEYNLTPAYVSEENAPGMDTTPVRNSEKDASIFLMNETSNIQYNNYVIVANHQYEWDTM